MPPVGCRGASRTADQVQADRAPYRPQPPLPVGGHLLRSPLEGVPETHAPRHVSVDSGFVRRVTDSDMSPEANSPLPPDAGIVTPQLGIMIHDTSHFAPLFRSEDFVVVLPESVRAVIEVKKCLDRSKLEDAVDTLAKTTYLLRKWRYEQNRLFTGIFAFSLGDDLSPKSKPFSESFRSVFQSALDDYGGDCELPYLTMALPHFALQESNPPEKFDHLRTLPEDGEGPNVASQLLVFLLSHFTSWGSQGRSLPCPDALRSRRETVFRVTHPPADASSEVPQ